MSCIDEGPVHQVPCLLSIYLSKLTVKFDHFVARVNTFNIFYVVYRLLNYFNILYSIIILTENKAIEESIGSNTLQMYLYNCTYDTVHWVVHFVIYAFCDTRGRCPLLPHRSSKKCAGTWKNPSHVFFCHIFDKHRFPYLMMNLCLCTE